MSGALYIYKKAIQPSAPQSFNRYVDQELDKVSRALADTQAALEDLQSRVALLETPAP